MVDPVQEQVVDHDGVVSQRTVLRNRQPWVVRVLADRHAGEQPGDEVLLRGRELGHEVKLLARTAEVHLRLKVRAVPYDDVGFETVLRDVDGKIAAGITPARHGQRNRPGHG